MTGGNARLLRIIFEKMRIEAQRARQTPRREAPRQQIFGQMQTKSVLAAVETRQPREGQFDLRENFVAPSPLFRSAADEMHHMRRDLPAVDRRQERQHAFFVSIEGKTTPVRIAGHPRQHGAAAENEPPLGDLGHSPKWLTARVFIEFRRRYSKDGIGGSATLKVA